MPRPSSASGTSSRSGNRSASARTSRRPQRLCAQRGVPGEPGSAGGPARHIPVLASQVVEFLNPRDGGLIIDATFGAGGYTRAILRAANCRVIGIDRDQDAIAHGADLVEE